LSTPSNTETFVTGDRVRYTFGSSVFHGTIVRDVASVRNWFTVSLEEYGGTNFTLPGSNMSLIPTQKDNQMSTPFEILLAVADEQITKAEKNLRDARDARTALIKAEREAS
jgi:hypothetical protein